LGLLNKSIELPGLAVKAMENGIKKISNGEVQSVGLDGAMKVNTPAGIMTKYFVCNRNYAKWLINAATNPNNSHKLPVPQIVMSPVVSLLKNLIGN
jgi:hypothetical protein